MLKNLIYFCIVIMFLFQKGYCETVYDFTMPLPGETFANKRLQYNTIMGVYTYAAAYNKTCETYSIADTKLIKPLNDCKENNGQCTERRWTELWTVNRCEQKIEIPVIFVTGKNGSDYSMIDIKNTRVIK